MLMPKNRKEGVRQGRGRGGEMEERQTGRKQATARMGADEGSLNQCCRMMVCEAMYVKHVTGYAGVVKYVPHRYMKGIHTRPSVGCSAFCRCNIL